MGPFCRIESCLLRLGLLFLVLACLLLLGTLRELTINTVSHLRPSYLCSTSQCVIKVGSNRGKNLTRRPSFIQFPNFAFVTMGVFFFLNRRFLLLIVCAGLFHPWVLRYLEGGDESWSRMPKARMHSSYRSTLSLLMYFSSFVRCEMMR